MWLPILHRFGYGFYSVAIKCNRSREKRQINANTKLKGYFQNEKNISLLTVAILLLCALTGCGSNKEAVATDGST
jgi:hypothetical protein